MTKPLSSISPVMPLITASCASPGGRCSRFQAMASLAPLMSVLRAPPGGASLPIQGALAPLVDEADRQHRQEGHHRQEAEPADLRQAHGPGEQEGDLEV